MMISVFDRAGDNIGMGENAVYQHFLLFQQYFQKSSSRSSKRGNCVIKGYRVILSEMTNFKLFHERLCRKQS